MTITATSRVQSSADHLSARESRLDDERASDFAGMLSGAVRSSTPRPEPKRAKEGTSELDRPDEAEADDKKKVKRSRPRAGDSSASDTSKVVQSTSSLDPELQAKLGRVVARMRDETGQNVTVAETYRSQERQDALFAQGRETSGPIVTWTQNSKHTQGRAVDVVLENGQAGFDAYTTLQRIANEEGLRTLGARDPGHLELPGAGQLDAKTANVVTPPSAEPAGAVSPGGVSIARLAQVAQVAQVTVERPAEVARVATVARPGAPVQSATGGATHAVAGANDAGAATQRTTADSNEQGESEREGGGQTKGEHRGYSALAAAVAMRESSQAAAPAQHVSAAPAVTGAERAAEIIAAYQDAPARPLSQIRMAVDAGNGLTDHVQVSLRGASLNAAIEAGDTRGAQAMSQRADELVRALTRDGVEVESLRVRAAAGTASLSVAGPAGSQGTSDAATHSKFDRNNSWQQQDRQQSQNDRRQQQRNSRGGRDQ